MMSAELTGNAPQRFDGLMYSLSGMLFTGSAAFLSKHFRRRRSKAELESAEDSMFEDEDEDEDDDFEVEKRAAVEPWQMAETCFAGRIA